MRSRTSSLVAADWNGEVYWRHLTTFMELHGSLRSATSAALGAAVAGVFLSPVVGASLAAAVLVTDTFIVDYTGHFDVEAYAALREATSLKRAQLRSEISRRISDGDASADSLSDILVLAYDYAFTYSIKGAMHTVKEQQEQLKLLLITGESPWRVDFADDVLRYRKLEVDMNVIKDPAEREAIEQAYRERFVSDADIGEEAERIKAETAKIEAETARMKADSDKLDAQRNLDSRRAAPGGGGTDAGGPVNPPGDAQGDAAGGT